MVSLENLEELWGTKHSSSSVRASCHHTDGGLRINAPRIGMGHSTEAQQTCAPQRKKKEKKRLFSRQVPSWGFEADACTNEEC